MPTRCFLLGVNVGEGGKPETGVRGEKPSSQVETQPTYDG